MKDVIYYPYLEVQDVNWLKFATLYIGRLTSLIPSRANSHISEEYQQLLDEGNFITKYDSFYLYSDSATEVAINQVEKFLTNPSMSLSGISINYLKRKQSQNYEIFEQKFPWKWQEFCLMHQLGHESENGIKVSKEIAYIYMYALAKQIGDVKEKSPITDSRQSKEFLTGLNLADRVIETRDSITASFMQGIIDFKIPTEIDKINISEFIELRKDKDFQKNQKAFHETLDLYLKTYDNDFKSGYLDYLSSMERDIKRWLPLSLTTASTIVKFMPDETISSYVPPILDGLILIAPSGEKNELNQQKRSAHQFLTNISNLSY